MRGVGALFLTVCLCAVTPVAAAGSKERAPVGQFTVVKLARAPVLDGKVAPGEWSGALATSGIVACFDHTLIDSATRMAVGWRDDRLYFLFVCKRGPREWRLTKRVRFNDDYDFGDPSVEIWIAPPKLVPETYQNILNTYPAVMDNHQVPSRGYTGAGWRGHWKLGVSEDPDSYTIEASIPVADFGVGKIRDGDVWRMLLCRTCQGSSPRSQGSWSITQGFSEIPGYPPVTFRDDDVAVQLDGVETLLAGDYRLPLTLVAPRGEGAGVTVELRWHEGSAPGAATDIVETRAVTLRAGERERLEFAGEVKLREGVLTVTVCRAGGATIFRQSFPYAASGWRWSRPRRPAGAAPLRPLSASVMYGPETHTLVLRADILHLPERARVASGRVRVLDPAGGERVLLEADLPPFREWYSDAFLGLDGIEAPSWNHASDDAEAARIKKLRETPKEERSGETIPELPAGPEPRVVAVEVDVADAAGEVLASDRQKLELLRHRWSWQENEAGISEKVIPPWTPVQAGKGGFAVWNRELRLDGLGCAGAIDNGGVQQIEAMRLVALVDGEEISIEAGPAKVEKAVEAWVDFTGRGRGAGLEITARCRLEFDGYVKADLTIAPEDPGRGALLDQLYWEVVLPESEATHFATTAGGWAAVHDVTPSRWTSPETSTGMMIGDFVPYIWLTNSDRAFLWFADSDEGWVTEEDRAVPTQEIVREGGRVTLRVRFIETRVTLRSPTTVRHGWMAFPSRALPPGFRSVIVAQGKRDYPGARRTHFWTDADWAVLWPYYSSPFPWSMERSRRILERSRGADHRPMVGSIAHSIGRYQDYEGRPFRDYAVDWGERPGVVGNSDVTQSPGPIDFRLWHYRRWVREAGFKGLYVDENYLSFDRNPLTGGAYLRPDGRVQPGYTYTGLRRYFKRMMYMFHAEGVARPNLWLHITSGAAYHAWYGDILMEGENVEPTDETFDYIEVLPAGRMRAIGSAACNGGTTIMMCQSQRHATKWEPKHTHQFVGWVLAHDILPEQVRWYGPIAQAARFHHDKVEFTGYWKPECPARTTTLDCLVSVHRTGDRALLWIVNTAREDREAEVTVDWEKLGLERAETVALDVETGREITFTGAGFTKPVIRRDFTAVLLVERRELEPGQSFVATFDHGRPEADQALGCEMLVGGTELVASDRGSALATGDRGVQLWSHLNLRDDEGRLTFRARLTGERAGVVLRTEATPLRGDTESLSPPVVIEIKKGDKEDYRVFLRTQTEAGPALKGGWHHFDLRWKDGRIRLLVDGAPAGSIPVRSLNIPSGTGPRILRMARFRFGGRGSVEAVDDITAWRRAGS